MGEDSRLRRRDFLKLGAAGAVAVAGGGLSRLRLAGAEPGRLTTRPHKAIKTIVPGEHVLADDGGRRTILFVPSAYDASKPAPFLLALHGATGSGDSMLRGTRPPAETHGVVVLSPSSRGGTWDAIRDTYGADLTRIDRMLNEVFDACAIDSLRVGVGGFSDGATYALSIGLTNGDVFTHIIAHSAGFVIPGPSRGKPKVFLSHGRQDPILPIDQCGRRIAAQLRRGNYSLRFDEFDGGHTASPETREAAVRWFVE